MLLQVLLYRQRSGDTESQKIKEGTFHPLFGPEVKIFHGGSVGLDFGLCHSNGHSRHGASIKKQTHWQKICLPGSKGRKAKAQGGENSFQASDICPSVTVFSWRQEGALVSSAYELTLRALWALVTSIILGMGLGNEF